MLQALFSVRKPEEESLEFYKTFYRYFSLVQINDIIMTSLLDDLKAEEREALLEGILCSGEEMKRASVYTMGMMMKDPSLNKRAQEDRGLEIEVLKDLENGGIDAFEWYLSINEFMQIYSVCEQAIKDFLIESNVDPSQIKEENIINKLFEKGSMNKTTFLKAFQENTGAIVEQQNEVIAIWKYFTGIRHLYMHSGGRITERFIIGMEERQKKFKTELDQLENKYSLIIERLADETDFFELDLQTSNILKLRREQINFFRNFLIIMIEALDEATIPKK